MGAPTTWVAVEKPDEECFHWIQNPSYLLSTAIIESDHEAVREFALPSCQRFLQSDGSGGQPLLCGRGTESNTTPTSSTLTIKGLKASTTLEVGEELGACPRPRSWRPAAGCWAYRPGWVTPMSATTCRPSACGKKMKTDIFHWHGYTSIYLDGKWVKATPAFNIELCEKFHLRPLEFNGLEDSIFHSFDLEGHRHMEYLPLPGRLRRRAPRRDEGELCRTSWIS